MSHISGLVRVCFVLLALDAAGCRSDYADSSVASATRQFEEFDHAPGTDLSCRCTPSIPALGMICLTSTVKWKEGYLDHADASKATRFFRAEFYTPDGKRVSLVAGAISTSGETNPNLRGIVPPGVVGFQPGLQLEHCFGGPSTAGCMTEVSTLRGGFLYAEVQSRSRLQGRYFSPWPFIIRSPAIPAGAYSGRVVLLSVPSAMDGNPLREVVYRPNQDSNDCSQADQPDASPGVVVLAQPRDGGVLHVLSKPSMYETNPLGPGNSPTGLGPDDSRFLQQVCAFVERVRAEPMPTTPAKTDPCTR